VRSRWEQRVRGGCTSIPPAQQYPARGAEFDHLQPSQAGNERVALSVDRHVSWARERSRGIQDSDRLTPGGKLLDAIGHALGDVHVPAAVDRDTAGLDELTRGGAPRPPLTE
jgi:hypothetical protein